MDDKREGCLRYKDKVTIVTGGSKGIGEGIVREFGKLVWTKTQEIQLISYLYKIYDILI